MVADVMDEIPQPPYVATHLLHVLAHVPDRASTHGNVVSQSGVSTAGRNPVGRVRR